MTEKNVTTYRVVNTYRGNELISTEYFFSSGVIYKTTPTRRAIMKRADSSVAEYARDSYAADALRKLLKSSVQISETREHKRAPGDKRKARGTLHKRGSKVGKIKRLDRREYVFFKCPKHDNARYKSRDPWISAWIMQDTLARTCPSHCDVKLDDMILTADFLEKES